MQNFISHLLSLIKDKQRISHLFFRLDDDVRFDERRMVTHKKTKKGKSLFVCVTGGGGWENRKTCILLPNTHPKDLTWDGSLFFFFLFAA